MVGPWGITFSNKSTWAVADTSNHFVYLLTDRNELIRKLGGFGTADAHFSHPDGLIFVDNLFVVDRDNHRVQKFVVNGNYLLQFGSKGSNSNQVNGPHGILAYNDNVYIAD